MNKAQNIKEIQEAIVAGKYAIQALENVEKSLSSARSWGIFDMLGGGLITGMLKHSNMDKAQAQMEEAQRAVECFRKELGDIGSMPTIQLSFDGMTKALDYLLDDFFLDFMVQHEIKERRREVAQVKEEIQQTVLKLQQFIV